MSRFAEVIVLARGAEEVMEPLTKWHPDPERLWFSGFKKIDDHMFAGGDGGSSECYAWVTQFERPKWSGFLEYLERVSWPQPWSVQVLIRDQDDDCFGIWMIFEGRFVEVPIPNTRREEYSDTPAGVLIRTDW